MVGGGAGGAGVVYQIFDKVPGVKGYPAHSINMFSVKIPNLCQIISALKTFLFLFYSRVKFVVAVESDEKVSRWFAR